MQISGLPASLALIIVQIKGPTQNFTRTKPIEIREAENVVFVQTDKPIYKPGQTGIRNKQSKDNCGDVAEWYSL